MTNCDEIKRSIAEGDDGLRQVLEIFYDPDSGYSKSAKIIWLRFKRNQKVMRIFPDWRELFWDAFNLFAKRAIEEQTRVQLKSLEETLGQILDEELKALLEEEIKKGKKGKEKKPIEDCLKFFKTTCYFLCLEATHGNIEKLPEGEIRFVMNDTYSELYWHVLEHAINQLDPVCRILLVAKFYYQINDVNMLSALTGGRIAPGVVAAKIAQCKNKLRNLIGGIDLDDFEE